MAAAGGVPGVLDVLLGEEVFESFDVLVGEIIGSAAEPEHLEILI
jgi:hypothetical protein